METFLPIREVAARTGVSVHTLRYYERAGLLPRAGRSAAGYRLYTAESVRRVMLVRTLRSVGFGIKELRGLGAVTDLRIPTATMRARLRAKRDQVSGQLRDLERAWKLLDALQGCRCRGDCVLVTRLLDRGESKLAVTRRSSSVRTRPKRRRMNR
ncbi:MAG TPA: MerR family transcriptional regulator [Candidatus Eisenbacteria bacterium]|nr:MerR family transcriptional regulator [Candidatus Eisenbacteria bacterium]